ncbi:hypothetical protein XENOCAPTIV_023864 [Xenoophorus captivus]|uniref:Uncharacterized protein n=1 Tax=Xenoophorus captivus TaxID=1517983 RepID=A0ABV0S8G0_9TELE
MDGAGKAAGANTDGVKEDLKAAEADSTEGWGSCLRRIRDSVPQKYRNELAQLFKLAGPVVISQLMIFMISFVSMVFCGHLGKTELAGVSLSIAVRRLVAILFFCFFCFIQPCKLIMCMLCLVLCMFLFVCR